jgi:hypothetical protein
MILHFDRRDMPYLYQANLQLLLWQNGFHWFVIYVLKLGWRASSSRGTMVLPPKRAQDRLQFTAFCNRHLREEQNLYASLLCIRTWKGVLKCMSVRAEVKLHACTRGQTARPCVVVQTDRWQIGACMHGKQIVRSWYCPFCLCNSAGTLD